MSYKVKNFLIISFIIVNTAVYYLTKINSNNIIEHELKENLTTLQTHYEILYTTQKNISFAIHKSILRNTDVKELLNTNLSKQKQAKNRTKLHSQLIEQYETAKKQGVLQLQFVDKNNISFLRMHKPDKFGDDLTDIRDDFKYTNETKKPIRAFVQGRVAHGFRNVFPIFDKNNTYRGAIEISFSSDRFEWFLNKVSHIHAHFLVNKKVFDAKTWQRDDLVIKYRQSNENMNYMLSYMYLPQEKCISEDILKLEKTSNEIQYKMSLGKAFSSYAETNDNAIIFSFLPIYNLANDHVAWLATYKKSSTINSILLTSIIIRSVIFVLSLIIMYFLILQILSKQKIQQKKEKAEAQTKIIKRKEQELQIQHNLFDIVLNATNNIMFITDFKNIQYSNENFKELPKIEKRRKYITKTGEYTMNCLYSENCDNASNCNKHFNILDLFVVADGYLHKELLKENESFIELLRRVEEKDRVVSVVDGHFEQKAFTINIKELEYNKSYLITLSDITQIKENFIKTEKKAYIDGLTRVYNRNKFDELFEQECKRAKRYAKPFSVALIDIDNFKNFNDNYGHLIGDQVLITMAQILNDNIRATDIFARWGGEEFVILFIDTEIQIAKTISDKLRTKISDNKHETAGRITASFGLSQYKEGDTMDSIFKRCDDALYKAKKNGKNRVEI